MMEWVLFSSLAAVLYVYLGYPLLLCILGAFRTRPVRRQEVTPSVSVIIPVHNEEGLIAEKLRNTLGLDYPKAKMEIIVASDGSTDGTEAIATNYGSLNVCLLSLPRRGKLHALNEAAARARGEILLFTDANATLERSALRELVAHFADSEVGGVCGNQEHERPSDGSSPLQGELLYWSYDKLVKLLESCVGSAVAAHGSIYAIRGRLFAPCPDVAQADDFAISAEVIKQGYRLVYEPGAVSYEDPPSSSEREFWRKVRVANHSMRAIWRAKQLLNPWRHGFYAVELFSHKVLRYLVPVFLIGVFVSNSFLTQHSGFYLGLLGAQLLFYGGALAGFYVRHHVATPVFHFPFYFCLANGAALLALFELIRGSRIACWQPVREGLPRGGHQPVRTPEKVAAQ